MDRITAKHLEASIKRLNDIVGHEAYSLSRAYGGYKVYVKDNRDLFNSGHRPARAVYHDLYTFKLAMSKALNAIDDIDDRNARELARNALLEAFSK
jgi:hypothetical protein